MDEFRESGGRERRLKEFVSHGITCEWMRALGSRATQERQRHPHLEIALVGTQESESS